MCEHHIPILLKISLNHSLTHPLTVHTHFTLTFTHLTLISPNPHTNTHNTIILERRGKSEQREERKGGGAKQKGRRRRRKGGEGFLGFIF